MLRKLLKHEFRATARIMVPLYLIVLAMGFGGGLSIQGLALDGRWIKLACVLGCAALCIITAVFLIWRFSHNLLGDEGYLMLTLPVSVHKHIGAKMLAAAVWFLVSLAVAVLTLVLLVRTSEPGFGSAADGVFLVRIGGRPVVRFTGEMVQLLAEGLLLCLISCCTLCLQFYASLAVGHSLTRHKWLGSAAVFALLQVVTSRLVGLVPFSSGLQAGGAFLHQVLWTSIAVTAAVGAVYYLLTVYFLKKHLNLA